MTAKWTYSVSVGFNGTESTACVEVEPATFDTTILSDQPVSRNGVRLGVARAKGATTRQARTSADPSTNPTLDVERTAASGFDITSTPRRRTNAPRPFPGRRNLCDANEDRLLGARITRRFPNVCRNPGGRATTESSSPDSIGPPIGTRVASSTSTPRRSTAVHH